MQRIIWNTPLNLVAGAYAGVLALSTLLVVQRYFAYKNHPDDVTASSGMWAGGDLMLEMFSGFMFFVVTFFLMLVIAKSEPAYTIFSKVLLAVSLTAPISVAVISIPSRRLNESILAWACMFRLFACPIAVFGLGLSRLFARFPRPKKLTFYAFVVELSTLIMMVALLFFSGRHGRP